MECLVTPNLLNNPASQPPSIVLKSDCAAWPSIQKVGKDFLIERSINKLSILNYHISLRARLSSNFPILGIHSGAKQCKCAILVAINFLYMFCRLAFMR
jgi:hypothetical protein